MILGLRLRPGGKLGHSRIGLYTQNQLHITSLKLFFYRIYESYHYHMCMKMVGCSIKIVISPQVCQ